MLRQLKDWIFDNIYRRAKPAQSWAMNGVPRTWIDKPELIPILLGNCLINYWEDEGGEQDLRLQYEMEKTSTTPRAIQYNIIYSKLKEAYEWFKYQRKEELKELENAGGGLYFIKEKQFELRDQTNLTNIIKYKDYLWT